MIQLVFISLTPTYGQIFAYLRRKNSSRSTISAVSKGSIKLGFNWIKNLNINLIFVKIMKNIKKKGYVIAKLHTF